MEITAVLLGLAYLVLAIRQNPWCWPAGIASSVLYVKLMADTALYMESGLQVFYVAMGGYGWWQWVRRVPGGEGAGLRVQSWTLGQQLPLAGLVVVLTAGSGFALARWTDAAVPFVDAFVTWGALVATWMTARKILETWHWWLVVDGVSLLLYLDRGLYPTAALFAVYLVLVVIALRTWQRSLARDAPG